MPKLPIDFNGEIKIDMIETKSKSTIPVICFQAKNAKSTILYSHGNATDLGAMYSRYLSLAASLQ